MRGFLLAAAGTCALLLSSWVPIHAAGAGGTVTAASYRIQIHHLRLTLGTLAARPGAPAANLAAVESRLRTLGTVRLANGSTISTPLPGWAWELQSGKNGAEQDVARQVAALDGALARSPAAAVSPAAMGRLDAILRDARFQHPQPLQERILQWLGNLVLQLLSLLGGAGAGLSLPLAILFAVILLGLVAGLAYLLASRALGRMVVEVAPPTPTVEPVTSVAAAERASRLVAAGDHRTALRYLFLATLLKLQEQKLLTLRPGMTNRDYLRSLDLDTGVSPARRAALAELTEQFDRAWYGHVNVGAADYARCVELARSVTAPQPREPAA